MQRSHTPQDSRVEQGVRAMAEARQAAEKEAAARVGRVGFLRLRVWDEGAGRYVQVAFAAQGDESNPGGGTSSLAYSSGEDGWGRAHEFEPGRYDLLVYEFTCNGEMRMGNWIDPDETAPRFSVTIESGKQVDRDIRLDLCALPHDAELDTVGDASGAQVPMATPVP